MIAPLFNLPRAAGNENNFEMCLLDMDMLPNSNVALPKGTFVPFGVAVVF